jgi:synaptic vesicle membrane protein VAT-1
MQAVEQSRTAPRTPRQTTMKKVVIAKPGSYERLAFQDFPSLVAGPDDVVIDVRAIGVNYADCIVRMGLYASAKEFVGWPVTPGFEVAGVVRAVGENVTDLREGDRVFGVTLFDGYATEARIPRHQVFRIPDGLGFDQAAGLPSVYMTAYFAVHELAHPRKGSRVLIHSAAGGVGGCLVQLCKIAGAFTVGVVGATHKVDVARKHGCDEVIDKSTEPLWEKAERFAPKGYDVVFDANGVSTLKASYQHLRPAGKLVVYGFHAMMPRTGGRVSYVKLAYDYLRTPRFNPLDLTNESKSILAFNLSYLFDRADLLEEGMALVMGWLAEGRIEAPPVTTYPFERVADAHRAIESGQTVGKLVLLP